MGQVGAEIFRKDDRRITDRKVAKTVAQRKAKREWCLNAWRNRGWGRVQRIEEGDPKDPNDTNDNTKFFGWVCYAWDE